MAAKLPNCRKCKNFFVTYEPNRPYGCRAMGFKSKRIPAAVVYETSGIICQLYTPRKKDGGKKGGGGFSRTA